MGKEGQFFLYFNKEDLQKVVEKFGTVDKNEIKECMKADILKQKSFKDFKSEREILQLENLKKRNISIDITNRIKLIHELHISPSKAIEIASGRATLDIKALNEQGLACPDCNWRTDSTCDDYAQQGHMIYHLKDVHKRLPTEEEKEILMECIRK